MSECSGIAGTRRERALQRAGRYARGNGAAFYHCAGLYPAKLRILAAVPECLLGFRNRDGGWLRAVAAPPLFLPTVAVSSRIDMPRYMVVATARKLPCPSLAWEKGSLLLDA